MSHFEPEDISLTAGCARSLTAGGKARRRGQRDTGPYSRGFKADGEMFGFRHLNPFFHGCQFLESTTAP